MAFSTHLQSKFAHAVGEIEPAFRTDHPIHPAIVHFPIAFNLLAWSLDILYALTVLYIRPAVLTARFGSEQSLLDITRLGYFLLCLGLLSSVPAIMTGNIQLVGMIKKNGGPWEKDAQGKQASRMVPRIKVAITHALVNDLVFFANLYSWYIRRAAAHGVNLGHPPSPTNVVISVTLIPALISAAKDGAHLVYNHGVGLSLGRKKIE